MEPVAWGVIGFVALLVLLVLGVHVGLALAAVGFLGLAAMSGSLKTGQALLATTPFATTDVFALTILPLFILMGLFAGHAGLSGRALDAAHRWVGRLPGGMAIATTWGNALFAACIGDAVVACAIFTRTSLPQMRKHAYDKSFACGTIAAAGMLWFFLPPRALIVTYGSLTEESIGVLLIAGIGPGLLLTLLFTAGIVVYALRFPHRVPPSAATPWREKIRAVPQISGILALIAAIVAGIYTGVFTPTEAAAAGATGALLLALAYRGLSRKKFLDALKEASQTTALIFFILIGAMIFARFLALTGLPSRIVSAVTGAGIPPFGTVVIFLVLHLFLGMFLDEISLMSITLPIVHPVILELGVDPIHFAMLVVVAIEIGLLTPPVGLNVYTVKSVANQMPEARDVSLEDVFRGTLLFLILSLLALLVLLLVPDISTFLPRVMLGR